jgi:hypothetical protein
MAHTSLFMYVPWGLRPAKVHEKRQNDMPEPILAIPFVFSAYSFLADGFSTLRHVCGGGLVAHT